jgi:dUTP pyrophosphatase
MEVKIKTISSTAILPSLATPASVGYDIRTDEACEIYAGEVKAVRTGIVMEIPPGYECQIRSRSGLAMKHQVFVPNSPGTIDPDFRGEVKVLLFNAGAKTFKIEKGDRIAQLVFNKVEAAEFITEFVSTETSRAGGFGSSGIK